MVAERNEMSVAGNLYTMTMVEFSNLDCWSRSIKSMVTIFQVSSGVDKYVQIS
jgi:hypothetical protein